MKKLAVVLLVLAVASLAQASFFLTINGQDVESVAMNIGDSVTVGINSTDTSVPPEPTAWGEYGQYHQLSLLAVTPGWTGLGTITNGVINANAGASAGTVIWGSNSSNSYWGVQNPADLTPGLWFEWTFTNTVGVGNIHLQTWGPGWTSTVGAWDTVAVTAIPEPATMTLLGLGLVALFRKK